MRMKTVSLTAAFLLAGATVASACSWSKDAVAQTPVDYDKLTKVELAEIPVDAWLIEYLEDWRNA